MLPVPMTTDPAETPSFGATLRRLRESAGLTLDEVTSRLPGAGGESVTPQALAKWEKGGRTSAKNALALERVLGAEGELANLLGYRGEEDVLSARVAALESRQQEILDALARLESEMSRLLGD